MFLVKISWSSKQLLFSTDHDIEKVINRLPYKKSTGLNKVSVGVLKQILSFTNIFTIWVLVEYWMNGSYLFLNLEELLLKIYWAVWHSWINYWHSCKNAFSEYFTCHARFISEWPFRTVSLSIIIYSAVSMYVRSMSCNMIFNDQ